MRKRKKIVSLMMSAVQIVSLCVVPVYAEERVELNRQNLDNIQLYSNETESLIAAEMEYNGHTYQMYDENVTWKEAEEKCRANGGYLAVITDDKEENAIKEMVKNGTKNDYWLNASDEESEGNWKWLNGETWSYTDWNTGEPNNSGGNENYLSIARETLKWNDLSQTKQAGYICEYEYIVDNTVEFNKHKYEIYNKSLTWENAKEFCEEKGGHLVTVTNLNEQKFIEDLIKDKGTEDSYYMGAIKDDSLGWHWITGEQWEFEKWGDGEPSNSSGNEKYLEIVNNGWEKLVFGDWNDVGATSANRGFICEWDNEQDDTEPTQYPSETSKPTQTPNTETSKPTQTSTPVPTRIPNTEIPIPSESPDINSGVDGAVSWFIENGELRVTGSGEIPAHDKTTAPWNNVKDKITKISVGEGITAIGNEAFQGLDKVEELILPKTLTVINARAFRACKSIKNVEIPKDKSIGIGEEAFAECSGLINIEIPKNVVTIGKGIFEGCSNIKSVILPFIGSQNESSGILDTFDYIFNGNVPEKLENVEITNEDNIPENAFKDLTNLKNIIVNNDVKTIGNGAFDGCTKLEQFIIPLGITTIGDNTFRNCESAAKIEVPNGINEIGSSAFDGCRSLESINIPYGVRYLPDHTFRNCESLISIEIPDSVENIGIGVLKGCKKLKDINLPFIGVNRELSSEVSTDRIFGYLFGEENNMNIPPSVTKVHVTGKYINGYIPKEAFKDCGNIVDIIIDGGRTINDYAFVNCRALKNLYIPKTIATIGNNILENCTRIETLAVPFIGESNRDNNAPTSVLGAFFGIDNDDKVGTVQQYYNSEGGNNRYKIPATLKNISVLNQITIPTGAFMSCYSVEKVAIVTGAEINQSAFFGCTSLKEVSLPWDLSEIGSQAFANCDSLETINIPNKVKTIGSNAFYNARNLKNVTMPDSVINIADEVFNGTNLTSGDDAEIFANGSGVITCSKDSKAYEYAIEHNINTNVVPKEKLDIRKTSTTVTLLSTNSYLFDITDTHNMRGILHIELYDNKNNKICEKIEEASDVEYRVEFLEEDMDTCSYAKIYITDENGNNISTEYEYISKDGSNILIIPENNIKMVYKNGKIEIENASEINGEAVLIEVIYSKGRLNSVKLYSVHRNDYEIDVEGAEGASYMLWDSISSMNNIADKIEN